MKRILVLGAGLVAAPSIRYLLSHKFKLSVAALNYDRAVQLIGDSPNGKAIEFDLKDATRLTQLIAEHDLTISLLPPPCHPIVARECVAQGKNMVTTSYRSPEVLELHEQAKAQGSLIMMETGVDPGLDHMSLMAMIESVQSLGQTVIGLRSRCGGLPAPGSNDNPWGYKFSWSPKGVLAAGTSEAHWKEDGALVHNPEGELHRVARSFSLQEIFLERYPNRNSLPYESLYGLSGIRTLLRETLRYPGWCESIKSLQILGWLDTKPIKVQGMSYREVFRTIVGTQEIEPFAKDRIAEENLNEGVFERMVWLGLLGDNKTPFDEASPLDILVSLAQSKMPFEPGERDMLVMDHELEAQDGENTRVLRSTLFDYGEPHGDSAMSRTVGLPSAIVSRLVLDGAFQDTGVHIPTSKSLYKPVLDELKSYGILFQESVVS